MGRFVVEGGEDESKSGDQLIHREGEQEEPSQGYIEEHVDI